MHLRDRLLEAHPLEALGADRERAVLLLEAPLDDEGGVLLEEVGAEDRLAPPGPRPGTAWENRLVPGLPDVDADRLRALCRRWDVRELSLFGSAIRLDFGPASDVDVLVSFSPTSSWSLLDLLRLRDELESLFGRRVDLVEKEAVRNPFRRRTILGDRRILYAA